MTSAVATSMTLGSLKAYEAWLRHKNGPPILFFYLLEAPVFAMFFRSIFLSLLFSRVVMNSESWVCHAWRTIYVLKQHCVLLAVFELLKEGEVLVVPTDNPMSEKEAWLAFRDVVHGLEYRKSLSNT